jgi:hypothetical protein
MLGETFNDFVSPMNHEGFNGQWALGSMGMYMTV